MALRTSAERAAFYAAATEAKDVGGAIYCPILLRPSGFAKGLAVDTWGAAIAAIEAAGYRLEHWAIDGSGNARPVFRRAA